MSKMLAFRVDDALERRIKLKAAAAAMPVSAFLRQAVERTLGEEPELSPYEAIKHLIGTGESERTDLSEDHDRIIAEKLRAEHDR